MDSLHDAHSGARELPIFLNQITTYSQQLHEDVLAVIDAGYAGIALWRRKLEAFGEELAIDLLDEIQQQHPYRISSLSYYGGFTGAADLSLKEALEEAQDGIDYASRIGAESIVVVAGGRNNHIRSHARRLVTQSLDELSDLAAAFGVQVLIEPMCESYEDRWDHLHTLDDTLDILAEIDRPTLGLVLNTYHLRHEAPESIAAAVPWIQCVRLADGPDATIDECGQTALDDGDAPWRDMLQVLFENGYSNGIELSLWSRDVWDSPDSWGRHIEFARDEVTDLHHRFFRTPATLRTRPSAIRRDGS